MSNKATIFLTNDQEHWYYDFSDDTITIEISRDNIIDYSDNQDFILEVKPGSDLYECLLKIRGVKFD